MEVEDEGRGEGTGYWRCTVEFRLEQVDRIRRREITAAESSRELRVARSLVQRCKYLLTKGCKTTVVADEDVVSASVTGAAQQRIRNLQRVLGQESLAVEIQEARPRRSKKE